MTAVITSRASDMAHLQDQLRCQLCPETAANYVVQPPETALSQRSRRTRPLDAGFHTVAAADALTTKVREGGRVNVHTSVATGVSARARTESPVPIGGEPFRQGREHGHSHFWPLLQYGV